MKTTLRQHFKWCGITLFSDHVENPVARYICSSPGLLYTFRIQPSRYGTKGPNSVTTQAQVLGNKKLRVHNFFNDLFSVVGFSRIPHYIDNLFSMDISFRWNLAFHGSKCVQLGVVTIDTPISHFVLSVKFVTTRKKKLKLISGLMTGIQVQPLSNSRVKALETTRIQKKINQHLLSLSCLFPKLCYKQK